MKRVSLQDLNQLPDILSSGNWVFIINDPPGTTDTTLYLKCSRTKFSGKTQEPIKVELFGYSCMYRGRYTNSHQLDVSYYEDMNGNTSKCLESWFKTTVGNETDKSGYARDADLFIFDHQGSVVFQKTYKNMFPSEVSGFELNSDNYTPIQREISFNYDYSITNYKGGSGSSYGSNLVNSGPSGIGAGSNSISNLNFNNNNDRYIGSFLGAMTPSSNLNNDQDELNLDYSFPSVDDVRNTGINTINSAADRIVSSALGSVSSLLGSGASKLIGRL